MCWWIPVMKTSGKSSPWKNSLGPKCCVRQRSLIEPDRDRSPRSRCASTQAKRLELRARLQTPTGRSRYAARRITVEPAIGIIKSALGFVRFQLRGLHQVKMNGIWSVWLSTAAAWPRTGCEKHHDRSVILFFLQAIHLTRIFPPASTFPSKLLTQVRQAPATVARFDFEFPFLSAFRVRITSQKNIADKRG